METRANYVIVGSFVLACLVGLVAAVVWLADVDVDREVTRYDILFKGSVTGLQTGNTVRYSGVPVGIVTNIRINSDNVEQVRVTIEVPSDTPIKEDTVASLEYQGLTGVGYVELSGGTNAAPLLRKKTGEENPVIASKPSQLQAVFEQAPELIGRFIALVDRANLLLRPENQQNFTDALANVNDFTGALKDSSGDLKLTMAEASATMTELRQASAEARQMVRAYSDLAAQLEPEIAPTARSARASMEEFKLVVSDLRGAAATFSEAAESVAGAAEAAEGILTDNRDSVNHFAGSGLMEFTQLMGEMRGLVSSLTRISNEIERDPARFFFGDTQQGFEPQ